MNRYGIGFTENGPDSFNLTFDQPPYLKGTFPVLPALLLRRHLSLNGWGAFSLVDSGKNPLSVFLFGCFPAIVCIATDFTKK